MGEAQNEKVVDFKIPKTLGGCADRLYSLRQKKAEYNKELKAINDEFQAVKKHLIEHLSADDANGVIGRTAKVNVIKREIPVVQDWERFYRYIHKHKAFHFLQRRVSRDAVKEIWDSKKKVPGVGSWTDFDVSCTKRR